MSNLYAEIEYYQAEIAKSLAEIEVHKNLINDHNKIIEALYNLQEKTKSKVAA